MYVGYVLNHYNTLTLTDANNRLHIPIILTPSSRNQKHLSALEVIFNVMRFINPRFTLLYFSSIRAFLPSIAAQQATATGTERSVSTIITNY